MKDPRGGVRGCNTREDEVLKGVDKTDSVYIYINLGRENDKKYN